MDREHLTRLIEDPARVQRDDIVDLKAMADRYPWFSAAHLLLAVGEHRQGDVLFDEQLRTSAAHLPSRAVLFDLVHPIELAPAPVAKAIPPIAPIPAPVLAPPIEEPAPPTAPELAPVYALVIEEAAPVPEDPIELPGSDLEEVASGVVEPPAEPPVPEEPQEEDQDPLDVQLRQAALASSYELLLEDTLPVPPPALREDVPPPAPKGRMSFSAWLDAPPPRPAAAQPQRTTATAPDAADLAATKALIDRFIQQATPPPPAKKAEFFTPQQAAKRSLEDHADMVTETLARIYEKQGNLAKAKAAYLRLAEKFPERSAHFMERIRSLEQR